MPVLHSDIIEAIFVGARKLAVFHIEKLALVDLQRLLSCTGTVGLDISNQDVLACLKVERVARGLEDQVDEIEVPAIEDVEIVSEDCRTGRDGLYNDGKLLGSPRVLHEIWCVRVSSREEIDAVASSQPGIASRAWNKTVPGI